MLGKAKPNQEAKLITSPFSGNSLGKVNDKSNIFINKVVNSGLLCKTDDSLAHLAAEHQIGTGSCQCGGASDAGSVTNTQGHPFTHSPPFCCLLMPGSLHCSV